MDRTFNQTKPTERENMHTKIMEKLQEEAYGIKQDDVEVSIITGDIVRTYKRIEKTIDLLKKKAESRSEVKSSKEDEKKLNKLKVTQEGITIKYNNNYEQTKVCEKKVEKIENEINEIKEKYDMKETDIRDKGEKKIDSKKKKIEEHEEAIRKLKEQINVLENDIEKIETDTEDKIKLNNRDRRNSIDKKLEDKEASVNYIEKVLNKRHEEYENSLTKLTEEYDDISKSAKLCLLTSDIKEIEESKHTINNKIQVTESQLKEYNTSLEKLEKLKVKYCVDDIDYDEKMYTFVDKNSDIVKAFINDIKEYPKRYKELLEEINKIV